MENLSNVEIRQMVQAALEEDIGSGDATTLACIPGGAMSKASMQSREPLMVCGIAFAEAAFTALSAEIQLDLRVEDGQAVEPNYPLLSVEGPTQAILSAERVALNFVQRLSGIATTSSQYVKAAEGTRAHILDTRKTTPLWRRIEKYAVRCGGGRNHRTGLFDMILIKDNHLRALENEPPNAIAAAVRRARAMYPDLEIEVEADTLEQVRQAADERADIILLDNMSIDEIREAVRFVNGRSRLEASGGVTLDSVKTIAQTGVDYISVGALTHSVRAVDIGLDFL